MKVIPITQGGIVLVDDEDYDELSKHKWQLNNSGHAIRFTHVGSKKDGSRRSKWILMHRFILGAITGQIVDHINRNKLDNRRANLRLANKKINSINRALQSNNTSGYRGITWDKSKSKWTAQIQNNGKNINLGRWEDIKDAIKARKIAEQKYFIVAGM